ncbi:MAG: hypothetical protein ACYCOU_07440 [Sulfobacillus sp.]
MKFTIETEGFSMKSGDDLVQGKQVHTFTVPDSVCADPKALDHKKALDRNQIAYDLLMNASANTSTDIVFRAFRIADAFIREAGKWGEEAVTTVGQEAAPTKEPGLRQEPGLRKNELYKFFLRFADAIVSTPDLAVENVETLDGIPYLKVKDVGFDFTTVPGTTEPADDFVIHVTGKLAHNLIRAITIISHGKDTWESGKSWGPDGVVEAASGQ